MGQAVGFISFRFPLMTLNPDEADLFPLLSDMERVASDILATLEETERLIVSPGADFNALEIILFGFKSSVTGIEESLNR